MTVAELTVKKEKVFTLKKETNMLDNIYQEQWV